MARPVDLFASVGDILVQTVGSPYREEPMTENELDIFADRVLMLVGREKGMYGENKRTD